MSTSTSIQLHLFENPVPDVRPGTGSSLVNGIPVAGPLELCVLGSGSSGNCTLVRHGDGVMMIDAGFGPRSTARRLTGTGVTLGDIESICVTHLDRDHFNPNWIKTLLDQRIHVYVHSRHVQSLYRIEGANQLHGAGLLHLLNGQAFEPLSGVRTQSILLPHDRKGTNGFLLESDGGRIGYATDLGSVPTDLIERFVGVDLLAIESNYDPTLQETSLRPVMLKRRIMGGHGHLSNQQAFTAVKQIINACPRGGPQHIVLLHPSRQCNSPDIIQHLFGQDRRVASRLTLTEQSSRTPWLTIQPLA